MSRSLLHYIAYNAVFPFVIIFAFLLSFLMTFQLIQIANLIAAQNVELSKVMELIVQIAATLVPLALPLSLLFASIYCINKLCQGSEYIAMRSFGLSNFKIYLPIFIFSFLLSIWIYQINQNFIPKSKFNFRQTVHQLKSKSFLSELQSGQFFLELPNVLLFAQNINKETFKMNDVFLQFSKNKTEKVISSKEGYLRFNDSDDAFSTDLSVELHDGSITTLNEEFEERLEKVIFKTYQFDVINQENFYSMHNKASAMTGSQLRKFMRLSKEELEARRASQTDLNKAKIEYYNRFNTPIICLLFPFLGFCLGISSQRAKSKSIAISALTILIIYYAIYFAAIGFAKKDQIHPSMAVFIPSIILSLIAVQKSRRLKWIN